MPDRHNDVLATACGIVKEAMRRPVPPLDEEAFVVAVEEFHRAYHRCRQAYPPLDRGVEAHDDATREGLEAFLGVYAELTT